MTVWLIEPRDPLIARDGKPFGVGVRAATLPFPFPSTTTGTVRTHAGLASKGFFDPDTVGLIDKVKQIKVRGPLLVELNSNDVNSAIRTWLMPSPLDAALRRDAVEPDKIVIQRLVPLEVGQGLTNLSQAPHGGDQLVPVGAPLPDRRKPYDEKDVPRFWQWEQFKQWLLNPDSLTQAAMKPQDLGYPGLHAQMRTHVAIDPQKLTAFDGQLFQTRGLEFTHGKPDDLKDAKRLALAVAVDDAAFPNQLGEGLAPLGGESRIAAWRESTASLPDDCLSKLQALIAQDEGEAVGRGIALGTR